MWVKCKILLSPHQPAGVYKCGDVVSGVLDYELMKQTQFTSATIQLHGKGKSSWTDGDDDGYSYSGKEDYVLLKQDICQRNASYKVEAGVHKYKFEFIIPNGLPSSFRGNNGKITYKIIAKFTKSGFLGSTKKCKTELLVYGNLVPCSKGPLIFSLAKPSSSLSSLSPIDMKVKIMKTLLVRGENIELEYSIAQNNTSVPVTGVKIKLFSETTYRSGSGKTLLQRKAIDGSSREYGVNKTSEKMSVSVPTSAELYSLQHSNVIKREYKLQVTPVLPFPHKSASVIIPIVITLYK